MISTTLFCQVVFCAATAGGLPAQAPLPSFNASAAVQAEWERRLPTFSDLELAKLPTADLARWERARLHIGLPGTRSLLPPELANPTLEIWERQGAVARTPQDRFTAMHFLNRLNSTKALQALNGLRKEDAKTWPQWLHLELPVATARLNGGQLSPDLQAFLEELQTAGKVDPVRAQAGRLKLVIAGKEQALLPLLAPSPNTVLALVDALKGPLQSAQESRIKAFLDGQWQVLGMTTPAKQDVNSRYFAAWRLLDLPLPAELVDRCVEAISHVHHHHSSLYFQGFPAFLPRLSMEKWAGQFPHFKPSTLTPIEQATLLPELRKHHPVEADALRAFVLASANSAARAAGIEDLPSAPADLEALAHRCASDADLESAQALIQAFDRWKLPAAHQKALLAPYLLHPDWGWRYQAYLQLKKLDPTAPWPLAPKPRPQDSALLKEAQRLATAGQLVRLRITFGGNRIVTLKLNPTVAPINVANLKLLAEKKFFDGRRVPRVVPDFVVQMGSPYDTMDGGPGYTVRCENSLDWYGPGSVGMALSGKDTGGSQFFITTNATPHLTGKYTRMGEVEHLPEALGILDNLELGATIVSVRVVP